MGPFTDIAVEKTGHVALIEIRRPPHNFFDIPLIQEIAAALEALDEDADCRAVVWAAQGKSFCAGANFGDGSTLDKEGRRPDDPRDRRRATPLYRGQSPVPHKKADHRGGAWRRRRRRPRACDGGGLPRRLPGGALLRQFHPARLSSGLRPDGDAAGGDRADQSGDDVLHQPPRDRRRSLRLGLADVLVPQDEVRAAAMKLAAEIAENSPLGLIATRATMRGDIADRVLKATEHELKEQTACARPTISRKASKRPPSGGCRILPAASGDARAASIAHQDSEHARGHGRHGRTWPAFRSAIPAAASHSATIRPTSSGAASRAANPLTSLL